MQAIRNRMVRWSGVVAMALAVAACGGGGGGGGGDGTLAAATPPRPADARNGTYTMFAADAHEYSLALNFDDKTYRLTGNGVDTSATFQEDAGTLLLSSSNATGPQGFSSLRFQMATDTVVGAFTLPSGTVPFIAPRKFVTSIADAVGVYNILGRTVDSGGAPPENTLQQGQITADGKLQTCDNGIVVLYEIASCPPASLTSATVTVSGDLFTAATPSGNVLFRVAQVGADKVFLRASASFGTTRRFLVGLPATAWFTDGNFVGGSTDPSWGRLVATVPTFASTWTAPDGSTSALDGTLVSIGSVPTIPGMLTSGNELMAAARSSELAVIVRPYGAASVAGYMAIMRKQ